jgi:predicted TIM-barrel enzyme
MSLSKCGAADIRRLVCSTMREAVKRVKNEGIVSTGEAAGQE